MKDLTRERLLDIASQLEGIVRELPEASEAPRSNGRRNLKAGRVAKHYNKIQSKIEAKKRMV